MNLSCKGCEQCLPLLFCVANCFIPLLNGMALHLLLCVQGIQPQNPLVCLARYGGIMFCDKQYKLIEVRDSACNHVIEFGGVLIFECKFLLLALALTFWGDLGFCKQIHARDVYSMSHAHHMRAGFSFVVRFGAPIALPQNISKDLVKNRRFRQVHVNEIVKDNTYIAWVRPREFEFSNECETCAIIGGFVYMFHHPEEKMSSNSDDAPFDRYFPMM
jgi:hypothetical protein